MSKISKEVAQDQLKRLLDFYLIELDDVDETEDGVKKVESLYKKEEDDAEKATKSACSRLLRYIQHGLVEVTDENGLTVKQHLRFPIGNLETLTYKVVTGNAQREMRHAADNDIVGKICCLMGALSNVSGDTLRKFSGPDIGVLQCLGAVFLTT
jgi:hypothetical protein